MIDGFQQLIGGGDLADRPCGAVVPDQDRVEAGDDDGVPQVEKTTFGVLINRDGGVVELAKRRQY